jgi:ketosteroid isomerase-like protein
MGLPDDPAAFIAEAERAINERDPAAAASVYAEDGLLESVTDGAQDVHRGAADIRRAWEGYIAAMDARDFTLHKTLTAASGDTIVNEWEGTIGGRTDSRGVEYWRFDAGGRVYEHRMYSHLSVKPIESPVQRLRLALAYPLSALALLREQRRRR